MTNYPYRVMTRGEFVYVVNVITMERVACHPMWKGQTYKFNCDKPFYASIKTSDKARFYRAEIFDINPKTELHSF